MDLTFMVLFQYYNLLLHRGRGSSQVEIIGEDKSALHENSSMLQSEAEEGSYRTNFEGVTSIVSTWNTLDHLPPGDMFTDLIVINISNCENITSIPGSYNKNNTLTTLYASNTKISSLPSEFMTSLQFLDICNCKRITSIGDMNNLHTLVMSNSTVNEIRNTVATTLIRLYSLNSRLSFIPSSPNLMVLLWSGVGHSILKIENSPSLISILTPGATANIQNITTSKNVVCTKLTI